MNIRPRQQGLIGLIIVLIIALILLGYMGFDVRKIIESPQVQENLRYGWGLLVTFAKLLWGLVVSAYHLIISFIKNLIS